MATRVLAVLPSREDRAALRGILEDGASWRLRFATTFEEALSSLRQAETGVVISESSLPGGHSWIDLLHQMRRFINPPPLIVVSRLADERLWAEVLNLGGYDLLGTPLVAGEVLWSVRSASLSSRRGSPLRKSAPRHPGTSAQHAPGSCSGGH